MTDTRSTHRTPRMLLTGLLLLASLIAPTYGQALSEADEAHLATTVREHMDKFDVPGLSLAIAKDGRLVLARGFGFADKESEVKVTPEHRFRIASISKPITSVAIHKLIEMGRLKMDERVFGEGGVLGAKYGLKPYARELNDITVQHLLEHAHGGWDNKDGDPMFQQPTFGHEKLIAWTLDQRPLDRSPGAGYSYSNFGFCLLGRVVEARSGMSYAAFVQQHIAMPCGAKSLTLGGNAQKDRRDGEVVYYGQAGADPYNMRITRMDAHGGWIATAPDLVRIAVRVDGFDTKPDLLRPASIASMTLPSAARGTYAKGWLVSGENNWWHTGSIPGSRSIMVRTHHGFCWAALSNTRSKKGNHASDLDKMMWRIVRGVKHWPKHDLFTETK